MRKVSNTHQGDPQVQKRPVTRIGQGGGLFGADPGKQAQTIDMEDTSLCTADSGRIMSIEMMWDSFETVQSGAPKWLSAAMARAIRANVQEDKNKWRTGALFLQGLIGLNERSKRVRAFTEQVAAVVKAEVEVHHDAASVNGVKGMQLLQLVKRACKDKRTAWNTAWRYRIKEWQGWGIYYLSLG